jgi:hypothetical protein
MRLPAVTLALLLLAPPALADVVHLKNGRTIEGKVVKRTDEHVRIKTAQGLIVLPMVTVERVESQATAEEELGDRAVDTDMNDPAAIERLALWASSRGLGDAARDLLALSRGLRLERLVTRAQRLDDPAAFLEAFYWGRTNDVSDEVLDWLISQAASRAPDKDPAVAAATHARREDLAARARDEARREELRRRPRYYDPEQERRFANALGHPVTERPGDPRRGVAILERARAQSAARATSAPSPGVVRAN